MVTDRLELEEVLVTEGLLQDELLEVLVSLTLLEVLVTDSEKELELVLVSLILLEVLVTDSEDEEELSSTSSNIVTLASSRIG